MSRAVDQYLSRYCAVECAALPNGSTPRFDHVLVIPCYRESPEFAQRLTQSALAQQRLLAIVVINQPHGPPEPQNRALMDYFQQQHPVWQTFPLSLHACPTGNLHWLVVDCFSSGRTLPRQAGVGAARKIGCDLAAALIARGDCRGPWIYSSDADAHLPDNYLTLSDCADVSAAVLGFHHTPAADPQVTEATALYEQSLHYYVDGLGWAGSPYAFHSVGSALAVHYQRYCQARGFPSRAGGEDFYLLNKLAKLAPVYRATHIHIGLQARLSDRVPFGTGPAVAKILALEDKAQFCTYSPECFVALRHWLASIDTLSPAIHRDEDPLQALMPEVREALTAAGITRLWQHIRKLNLTGAECTQAVHQWFDGFQTLKLIRRLQQGYYPAKPMTQCLAEAPFYGNER